VEKARSLIGVVLVAVVLAASAPLWAIADGEVDTTFAGGLGYGEVVTGAVRYVPGALHVGPGGAFTLTGSATLPSSTTGSDMESCVLTADYTSAGCAPFGFDLGTTTKDDWAFGVAYQLDGRRVLAGFAQGPDADPDPRIALLGLHAGNSLDTMFGNSGQRVIDFGGSASAYAALARRNGDLLVAGDYLHTASPGAGYDCVVARLQDGTLDSSFSGNGLATVGWDLGANNTDRCFGEALYANGRVVIAGSVERAAGSDFGVARLTATGDLDDTFSGNGKTVIPFDEGAGNRDDAAAVTLDRMDRIVVAGTVQSSFGNLLGVARLGPGGALDGSFATGGRAEVAVLDAQTPGGIFTVASVVIVPPPSNDILVSAIVGDPTGGSGGNPPVRRAVVVALREDGSLDGSFFGASPSTIWAPPSTTASLMGGQLALQGGKLLVAGGWFPTAPEAGEAWVVRLYRKAIFGDDFEGGKLRLWSDHADP